MWIMFLILALPFAFASNEEGKIISGGNLLITDMDVKVDENSDRNLEYGEEIDDEAEPDSIVEFALRIKNNHTGFDMDEVFVTVAIQDIDDGDDLEESTDEFDINENDDKKFTVELTIPSDVEQDTYTVKINAEGRQNATIHEVEYELDLVVDVDDGSSPSSSSLTDSIAELNKTITELTKKTNYYDPYTKCNTDLTTCNAEKESKTSEIATLNEVKTKLETCTNEKTTLQSSLTEAANSLSDQKLNISKLQTDIEDTKDNRTYWILGLIVLAIAGGVFARKKLFPERGVDEEAHQ